MNTLAWIIVAGLVLLYFIGSAVIKELRLITDRIGVLAEATWRIRDELTQINKRNGVAP
jgi:hypothetical protein